MDYQKEYYAICNVINKMADLKKEYSKSGSYEKIKQYYALEKRLMEMVKPVDSFNESLSK